jgi:PDZ domain-containing secreted protein
MKILRAFQVIKRDGMYSVSSTYNEVDGQGNITKLNEKDSFIAVDGALIENISAVEQYIKDNRLSE